MRRPGITSRKDRYEYRCGSASAPILRLLIGRPAASSEECDIRDVQSNFRSVRGLYSFQEEFSP